MSTIGKNPELEPLVIQPLIEAVVCPSTFIVPPDTKFIEDVHSSSPLQTSWLVNLVGVVETTPIVSPVITPNPPIG